MCSEWPMVSRHGEAVLPVRGFFPFRGARKQASMFGTYDVICLPPTPALSFAWFIVYAYELSAKHDERVQNVAATIASVRATLELFKR